MTRPELEPRFDDADLERCKDLFESIAGCFEDAADDVSQAMSSYTPEGQDLNIKHAVLQLAIAFAHMTKPKGEVPADKILPLKLIQRSLILGSRHAHESEDPVKSLLQAEIDLDQEEED